MPVEGINGFLDVESAALRAPQVGIANTNPQHILSVGSNLYVSGDSSDVLTVDGNVVCEGVKVGLIEIIPSYDLEAVANVGNSTSNTIQFTNATTAFVTTANIEVGTANLFVDTVTGRVGIGKTDPGAALDVVGDVEIANTLTVSDDIVANNGTNHQLTIDATTSMIYNKQLYFPNIAVDSYNYLGRFSVYSPPAIFNIWDSGAALGSGSRYSMSKGWGDPQPPIMNALEGSEFSTYKFYWEPEAAGGGSEENIYYHVWFSPSRAGDYTFYIHAKDYLFPTEPSSPTYNDVVYGMLNLLGPNGTQSHVVVGRPSRSGNATLQLHNESQTGDRLTHEAIQLFSNTAADTGDVSNVFITMTPSITNGGYGGYIEGWIKSGTNSGLSLGNISSGTKYRGLTITSQGSVGIGTTDPRVDLEIENVNGSPELRFTDPFSGSTAAWDARSNVLGEISWYSRDSQFTDSYGKVASITSKHFDDGWPDGALCFTTSSNGVLNEDAMVIDHNGNVGIGKTDPGYALDVVGDILASGNITAYSDRRLKSNIRRIESALDKVCALNGYTFMMNEKSSTGLIAQEILPILPEAVTGSEETNYAVAYGNMMGLIVEAIKELKQKIG